MLHITLLIFCFFTLKATDPQDWGVPRAFATTWTHMRSVYTRNPGENEEAWDNALSAARAVGFHGIVAVIGKDSISTTDESLARTCRAYLDVCKKHSMACVFSFDRLESPNTNPSLWSLGKRARSERLEAVAEQTASHPALAGYILNEEPEYDQKDEQTYTQSVLTLANAIRQYNPTLPIIIKGNEADADTIPKLPNPVGANAPHAPMVPACHLFRGFVEEDTTNASIEEHFEGNDKSTPLFVSEIALSKQSEPDTAKRSDFFCRALEKIIGYGWSGGIFGLDGDNTKSSFMLARNGSDRNWGCNGCLDAIAGTLQKLRDNGSLAPPTKIPTHQNTLSGKLNLTQPTRIAPKNHCC